MKYAYVITERIDCCRAEIIAIAGSKKRARETIQSKYPYLDVKSTATDVETYGYIDKAWHIHEIRIERHSVI